MAPISGKRRRDRGRPGLQVLRDRPGSNKWGQPGFYSTGAVPRRPRLGPGLHRNPLPLGSGPSFRLQPYHEPAGLDRTEAISFSETVMLEIFTIALAILTVAVCIIQYAVRANDVLNGRFFERPDTDQRKLNDPPTKRSSHFGRTQVTTFTREVLASCASTS